MDHLIQKCHFRPQCHLLHSANYRFALSVSLPYYIRVSMPAKNEEDTLTEQCRI